jgi:hypothetical protein
MLAEAGTPSAARPAYAAVAQGDRASAPALLSKTDHLRIAAEHLEAAGLKEEAQRVRQIAAKEASHPARAFPQFVRVDLHMLELPQTRLGKLSSERYGGSKDVSVMALLSKLQSADGGPVPGSDWKLVSLIEALRKDGLVKVLAAPRLLTVPDRSASIFIGGELPYPDKDREGKEVVAFKEYGTRLDVVPQIVSSDRIHLDFRLRVSEPDNAHGVQVGDQKIPALKTREMETGLNLRPGQTIALGGGLVEQRMRATASPPGAAGINTLIAAALDLWTRAALSPPGTAGDKRDAGGARGEADAGVQEFQLFVLVKAEIVSKGMLENAAVKPAIPR